MSVCVCDQTMRGHEQMILELVWDKEKSLLYSGGSDTSARSWMTEIGSEAKTFRGATRSLGTMLVRGKICKRGSI